MNANNWIIDQTMLYNPRLKVWAYYQGRAISGDIFVRYDEVIRHHFEQYGIYMPRRWNPEGVKIFSPDDLIKFVTEV